MKEYQQGIVKENPLKNVPGDLVECFGEGNIRNLIKYVENTGKKEIHEAYTFSSGSSAISAGSLDAQYSIIKGENLFSNPKDQNFLSNEEKEFFLDL